MLGFWEKMGREYVIKGAILTNNLPRTMDYSLVYWSQKSIIVALWFRRITILMPSSSESPALVDPPIASGRVAGYSKEIESLEALPAASG